MANEDLRRKRAGSENPDGMALADVITLTKIIVIIIAVRGNLRRNVDDLG